MAVPAKFEAAEQRLAGLVPPPAKGWTAATRAAALARLRATGLPGRRDEYWRYTDPAPLNAPGAEIGKAAAEEPPVFDALDRLRLCFVDGVFAPELSDAPELAGVAITRLAEVAGADIHWARDLYGVLEARGQVPVERPFAALNTAMATDGVLIHVTGAADKPVHLVYLSTSANSDAILHHVVRVETGAELTLLESGVVGARGNVVTEVDLADGAAFHHVRVQGPASEPLIASHLFARVGGGATFKTFTMTANGRLTRNECIVEMPGAAGVAHIAGIAMGEGKFHHDDTVFITHEGEGCESRQVFKKVLRSGAVGVFQGKILVKQGAQKTDGYQKSQSLLLDDDAVFLAKPELEIYADDVKCSHGSTSGAIDETALYYLRSRGIPRGVAEDLLVESFLAEALDEIDSPVVAEEVLTRLQGWLKHR